MAAAANMAPKRVSAAKRQRLEQQAADRAASDMVETMANFSDLAVERELEGLISHLRANPTLLYSICSYVRDGTLEALMNGQLARSEIAATAAKPSKDALKPRQKKWKHITEPQMKRVCVHLVPAWDEQTLPPEHTWTEIGFAVLGVTSTDDLPAETFPWCTTWPELLKAATMRYDALGKRFQNQALSDLFGLWKITDDNKAKFAFHDVAVDLPMGSQASEVGVSDPWDPAAEVTVVTPVGKIKCVLGEVLGNAGIDLFNSNGDGGAWDLPDYEEPSAAADDDDAASVASGVSASSAGSTRPKASPQMLSQALRARLQGAGRGAGANVPLPPS